MDIFFDMSLFFARFLGLYFFFVGIAIALSPERFQRWQREILAEERRAMMAGLISLLMGAFIVASHNVWEMDWPVFITFVGYWAIFKGSGLMMFPGFLEMFRPMIDASEMVYRFIGMGWALIGALMMYHGFMG